MNGGIPSPGELSRVVSSSLMAGINYTNPLTPANNPTSEQPFHTDPGVLVLPDIEIEAMRLGNLPPWWGKTNLFTNPITRATVLSGFYDGSYDALVDFFSDNQTELRWKKGFDGTYYSYEHVNYVGGDGPPVGGGGVKIVRSSYQKAKYLKNLAKSGKTPKWMNQWLQKGKVPPGYNVHRLCCNVNILRIFFCLFSFLID